MRAWGRGALPINKMADWLSRLTLSGYTQICVARGSVSWGSKDNDEAGELQLWCRETDNDYCINARKTARGDKMVCKVIDVFTLHFQKCTDKIKTLLTKKSKFHFVQYWKQIVPCESTDKGVSSRGSRVRTKFYGSIIDSGSERVLINIYNLTVILNPVLFKSHSNVSVVYVVNFLSHVIFCVSFVFEYGTTVDV